MATYSELRIRFEQAPDGDGYVLHVAGPSGKADGDFRLPTSKLELENLALRLSRGRAAVRRVDSPELGLARRFGTDLFDALFSGPVRDLYRDSLSVARSEGKGLRVTLALTNVPELMHVPWEYLYDDPAFLSISTWTPVVRYLDLPRGRPPLAVTQPLRILGMVSSPSDVVALDVGQEQRNLEQALADATARGAVEITWLERATLRDLQRAVRRVEYHVFHYIGHGGYDPARDDGVLLLEDDLGRSRRIGGAQLGTLLADEASLRLAVLNSCEGARTSSDDPYAGVATSLVQREVPAVVAMQFEITDRAALVFAGEFYAALADGYPVDSALAEARKAIFADENDVEWGTPVLYMRVPDGRIFDVTPAETGPVYTDPGKTEPIEAELREAEAVETEPEALPEAPLPAPPPLLEPPAGWPERRPTTESEPAARLPEPASAPRIGVLTALGLLGTLVLLLGVFFPWDYHRPRADVGIHSRDGRSWIDPHFDVPVAPHTGIVFALSAVAVVAGAMAALLLAQHPRTRRLASGLLLGFGVAGAAKYIGVLIHTITDSERTRPESIAVFFVVVGGALLLVATGIRLARTAGVPLRRVKPTALVTMNLAVAAILIVVGTLIPFNGGGNGSLGKLGARSIIPDEQQWLWLDPLAVAVGAIVLAFLLRRYRSALLAGILIALGVESAGLWLRYTIVPTLVQEGNGSFAAGGVVGLLGAVLLTGTGVHVLRGERAQSSTASPG